MLALSKGREHISLHGSKYLPTIPSAPHPIGLCLSCIPSVDGVIPCFSSPTEVPSWHSEQQKSSRQRKQVTGPQLPLSWAAQTSPRMWSSRAGSGQDWESTGQERGGFYVLPWSWLKYKGGTELESSPQCQGQASFKPQTHFWYQAQNPVLSVASFCCMRWESENWSVPGVSLYCSLAALHALLLSIRQCPQHVS